MKNFIPRAAVVGLAFMGSACVEKNMDPNIASPTIAPLTPIEVTTTLAPEVSGSTPEIPPTTLVLGNACVINVESGDTLSGIMNEYPDAGLTAKGLMAENGLALPEDLQAGQQLDICVGNSINDITGAPITTPPPTTLPSETAPASTVPVETVPPPVETTTPPPVETAPPTTVSAPALPSGVKAQQEKLNQLFAGLGIAPLEADGISGKFTQQQLCAARLMLNMTVSRNNMEPGSEEEIALMSAPNLWIPAHAPIQAGRWVVIDQTCQVMVTGEADQRIVNVFPTSTGQPEFPTRLQEASRVYKYDPALENTVAPGWHDSTHYPASEDNPLNGNMYKPLYFDKGQAIHGANNVPTNPESHGCARLRVEHMDILLTWLGLIDQTEVTYNKDKIGLTVRIQGTY